MADSPGGGKIDAPETARPQPATVDEVLAQATRELAARFSQDGSVSTKDRRLRGRIRALRALQLRVEGYQYLAIGAELGVTDTAARKAVKRGLEMTFVEPAREQIQLAVKRYERLLQVAMRLAVAGDTKAIREARELQSEITKLLGLAAPQKLEISAAEVARDTRDQARALGLNEEQADEAVSWVLEHLGLTNDGADI